MRKFWGFFVFFCLLATTAAGQTIEELQRQVRAAQAEIDATNALIEKNKGAQTDNSANLRLVNSKISTRKRMVANFDRQIALINGNINTRNSTIGSLERELAALKAEYASMMVDAYKSYRTNTFMAFLFAATDFNDVSRRIYYMKRYTLMRERKAVQIDSMSMRLSEDIIELGLKKDELDQTVQARNKEISNLSSEETNYRRIASTLNTQATQYRTQLAQKQKTLENLQAQIQRLIEEEARRSRGQARSTAETEAFAALSGRFDQNQGRLPYPVSGGVIIDHYGTHPHPTQKNLTVNNKGINIATERGANVRAVFDGEAVRVFFFQGLNNNVMIRHGNYLTVYSNLETVNVKAGDKVSANQVIGKLYSGADAENYMLHFEIWKETENLNPESWLRR
ncbi:MAG: peptidoglycan DD-metalloendopeptidase family protein [Rikenellaceae bacterium]|jgi:septal ring factor EnvC (AmiA/AmiB activator)|nr:peptidoglycan DD-metalloendopeptidase family protein [Rikenellaceae bacterium]